MSRESPPVTLHSHEEIPTPLNPQPSTPTVIKTSQPLTISTVTVSCRVPKCPLQLKSINLMVSTCTKHVGKERMGELACKLAREAVFGEEVMAQSTILGIRGQRALPAERIELIKETILQHRYPMMKADSESFKAVWKLCTAAINHACSKLRR